MPSSYPKEFRGNVVNAAPSREPGRRSNRSLLAVRISSSWSRRNQGSRLPRRCFNVSGPCQARSALIPSSRTTADRVCVHSGGDASRIWALDSTAAEVDARLRAFNRIGPKQAAIAVELLMSHFDIELADPTGSNVACDVHVRRFLRTGLVQVDNIDAITAAARRLHPERPGFLDLPTWLVGRSYCHATNPYCDECPLTSVCPRLTGRNV